MTNFGFLGDITEYTLCSEVIIKSQNIHAFSHDMLIIL